MDGERFSKDNNLQLNDLLHFKLYSPPQANPSMFKVTITRDAELVDLVVDLQPNPPANG
jgi:hypothetical protein